MLECGVGFCFFVHPWSVVLEKSSAEKLSLPCANSTIFFYGSRSFCKYVWSTWHRMGTGCQVGLRRLLPAEGCLGAGYQKGLTLTTESKRQLIGNKVPGRWWKIRANLSNPARTHSSRCRSIAAVCAGARFHVYGPFWVRVVYFFVFL